jgi:hypothetical protein
LRYFQFKESHLSVVFPFTITATWTQRLCLNQPLAALDWAIVLLFIAGLLAILESLTPKFKSPLCLFAFSAFWVSKITNY